MPIYEYTCLKCNAHTEVLQKMTDKPLTRCRKCKGKLEKQWSQTSFQLKGTGWYVTDYAAKKSDGTEKKGESASSESANSEAANSETAAKSDGAEKQKKATDSAKTDSTKSNDAAEKKSTEKSKKPTTTPSSSGG